MPGVGWRSRRSGRAEP